MNWYQLEPEAVFAEFSTGSEGISAEEAEKRLHQYGANTLPEEAPISRMKIILHQFTSPLIYILLAAAVVTAVLGDYIDTGVIVAVLILNALIGYLQEYKAETSVRALKNMIVLKARVVRDGIEQDILSERLVPGDVALLASGARVPADIRLFSAMELRIEEAALTGESVPVEKTVASLKEANLTPGDQTNMAFTGTIVVNGRARGIVVGTGLRTVLGRIAREVKELEVTATPLQQKIMKFARFIGLLVLGSAAIILILGYFLGMALADMFTTAVAASVAAVPEGLPVVVTVTMAIGISRMAKRHAIIRKLPAVVTLGSTTVICSDKTGTLTKNEMTVKVIAAGEHTYEVTGSGYDPEGEIVHDWEPTDKEELIPIHQVLRIGMLCNESALHKENGQYSVEGDPTEAALIVSGMKAGFDADEEKRRYPLLAILTFE